MPRVGTPDRDLMRELIPVNTSTHCLDIHRNLSITPRRLEPGPPRRIDGMTLGIVDMDRDAPHGGEMHPDGDEVLCVLSGRISVTTNDTPSPLTFEPGDVCIVPRGAWHRVHILEPARLLHLTPGPGGSHRPLPQTDP